MDDGDIDTCPACDALTPPLGILGNRLHYRCRDCGTIWASGPVLTPETTTTTKEA